MANSAKVLIGGRIMAITQKLREIGGIINSTDLNYNFNRMAEDLQLAVEGVILIKNILK